MGSTNSCQLPSAKPNDLVLYTIIHAYSAWAAYGDHLMNISTNIAETVNVTIYISVDSYNNCSDSPGMRLRNRMRFPGNEWETASTV
jgi:hypothetical protein